MSKSSATGGNIPYRLPEYHLYDFKALNDLLLLEYLRINIRITNTMVHTHIRLEY